MTAPLVSMDSEDNSFMLYTSGSTGKPKGIVHSTAGYLLYASVTHQVTTILYYTVTTPTTKGLPLKTIIL